MAYEAINWAMVLRLKGEAVSLHRTFLQNGRKAPVGEPRKLMPGAIPHGAAVRLGDVALTMGIAEGIETALAASAMFDMPVWAALNAHRLETWCPPPQVERVVVFGDNDQSMTGQSAAYRLAKRMRQEGVGVDVMIPDRPGTDWADELQAQNLPRRSPRPAAGE